MKAICQIPKQIFLGKNPRWEQKQQYADKAVNEKTHLLTVVWNKEKGSIQYLLKTELAIKTRVGGLL